jgi:hypothetical protein
MGTGAVILEKQPQTRHYSNTRMSGGGFHSPEPSGDREALKAYAKAMFSGENLPWKFEGDQTEYSDGLAELWAEYAPKNAAFMCGLDPNYEVLPRGGAAFPDFPGARESKYRLCNSNYNRNDVNPETYDSPEAPRLGKEGEAFHECILHGVTERGIPIHYDTRVLKLIHNDAGLIAGVKAASGGKELYYRAKKAVILTSGGYEYNKALRSAFLDGAGTDGWAFYGSPANTGDGIIMGIDRAPRSRKPQRGGAADRVLPGSARRKRHSHRVAINAIASPMQSSWTTSAIVSAMSAKSQRTKLVHYL